MHTLGRACRRIEKFDKAVFSQKFTADRRTTRASWKHERPPLYDLHFKLQGRYEHRAINVVIAIISLPDQCSATSARKRAMRPPRWRRRPRVAQNVSVRAAQGIKIVGRDVVTSEMRTSVTRRAQINSDG